MLNLMGRARAAALLVTVTVAALLPCEAPAQPSLPLLPPSSLLPLPDAGSLVVTLTSPPSGSTVSGTVAVSASVSIVGSLIVAGVRFTVDGADIGAEDAAAPYAISWSTTAASNGSHTLTAVARDVLGGSWASDAVTVTVANGPPPDTTPPTVGITSPASGATVSGTIDVTVDASDNVGVVGVQFQRDGVDLGAEDTTAPYSASWDTSTASNGSHTLTAVARDAAGNSRAAVPVTVTVSNAPPPPPPDTTPPSVRITSPTSGVSVSGTVNVTANASDNAGVVGVQFLLDGVNLGAEGTTAPYSVAWDTTAAGDGLHTLTAVARDAAGNAGTSAPVTVTVSNAPPPPPPDTTPPSVGITSPAAGATVSGTIDVTAGASDNVGVVGVQFLLDGVVGAEDTTAPYSVSWDTSTASNGSHTLTAVARDAAGNTATSSGVTVTVANGGSTTVTRSEEDAATYAGTGWTRRGAEVATFSGGTASSSNVRGNTSTFTFTGTAVSWVGLRCNICGIASVSIDGGAPASIDTASAAAAGSPGLTSEVVFTSPTLAAGTHTLVITVSGDATSGGAHVVVDAFDVTGGGASGGRVTRVEQNDAAVSYTGLWFRDAPDARASGGSFSEATAAGARLTLSFTGTGVSWLGYRYDGGGIARVVLDGTLVGEVDTYSASPEMATVFAAAGLPRGAHTLNIEITGTSNPAASSAWVVVDAFDVTDSN